MRHLLSLLLVFATTAVAPAGVLVFDAFDYPDGNIVTNSGGNWIRHSGNGNDSLVASGRYQISQDRSDDISNDFAEGNTGAFLFASFTINVSQLPTTSGTYFAHFKDETTSNFVARVFLLRRDATLPGTFRLGIANAAASATNIFPMDLATNVDYQVVVGHDPFLGLSTLYVDPAGSSDVNVTAEDTIPGSIANAVWSSYAFRQANNIGALSVDDLIAGNDFSEVVTNAPKAPGIAIEPVGATNYAGASIQLLSLGHGSGPLSYQWRRDGVNLSDGAGLSGANTNVLTLSPLAGGHSGDYDVVVSSPYGSATSRVAAVSVNTATTPPEITRQPTGATNSVGSSVTLSVEAIGPGPITYQWTFKGADLAGATTNRISFPVVTNENTGPYQVRISNPYGSTNSEIAYVQVLPPLRTNIAYLHTLQDPVTWLPTNTSAIYEVEGVVFTHTNITTAGNALFYIQDDTGGIAVFYGGSSTFRPAAGDRVRVVGPLAVFSSLLELAPSASNPLHRAEILSSGNPLPQPKPFAFSQTNDLVVMETTIEGSLVKLTNVYFPTATGTARFPLGANVTVTNAGGETFTVRVDARVTSLGEMVIPPFAYEVIGAMGQFQGNSSQPRNGGYQLIVTRPEDIVTSKPEEPLRVSIAWSGQDVMLTWPAEAGATYSVWATEDLAQPFQSIRSGLSFPGGEGQFAETASAGARFYRISRP